MQKKMISEGLKSFINPNRKWCIVKISPYASEKDIDLLYNTGFRQFHCCNTIPVKNGGLSGTSLIPYTKEKILYIKSKYPNCEIIAGGGIQNINILNMYYKLEQNMVLYQRYFFIQ